MDEGLLAVLSLSTLGLRNQLIQQLGPYTDCSTFTLDLGEPESTTLLFVYGSLEVGKVLLGNAATLKAELPQRVFCGKALYQVSFARGLMRMVLAEKWLHV